MKITSIQKFKLIRLLEEETERCLFQIEEAKSVSSCYTEEELNKTYELYNGIINDNNDIIKKLNESF